MSDQRDTLGWMLIVIPILFLLLLLFAEKHENKCVNICYKKGYAESVIKNDTCNCMIKIEHKESMDE